MAKFIVPDWCGGGGDKVDNPMLESTISSKFYNEQDIKLFSPERFF